MARRVKLVVAVLVAGWSLVAVSAAVNWLVTSWDGSERLNPRGSLAVRSGQPSNNGQTIVDVMDDQAPLQKIYGYGGALSQSSAYLMTLLKQRNATAYQELLRTLFDPDSANDQSCSMKVLRIPITASDYVTGDYYTYDDSWNDWSLSKQSLQVNQVWLSHPLSLSSTEPITAIRDSRAERHCEDEPVCAADGVPVDCASVDEDVGRQWVSGLLLGRSG